MNFRELSSAQNEEGSGKGTTFPVERISAFLSLLLKWSLAWWWK
jgi:hypothetical protein